MRFQAYPRYKPSGVEWLGDVPEDWTSLALRRVSTRYSGGTPDRTNDSYWEDGTIPWINSGAVNQGLITKPSTFITEEAFRNSSARWVPKGALVMALAGQGKTKGMVAQTGIATTCNQSMAAIRPVPSADARYLYWLLVSQYDQIRNMAGGEQRDGLNLEILGAIPCLKLRLREQRAIAAFLDSETARMDLLVAKKQELIERLKEKRAALISRTVTRGLPPAAASAAGLQQNPPLKPSGFDWLGDIPAHWGIVQAKRVSSVFVPQRDKPELNTDGDGYPWITVEDLTADTVSKSGKDLFVSFESARVNGSRTAPAGSILAACVGTFGVSSIAEAEVVINQQIQAYLPVRIHAPFLSIVIRVSEPYFEQMATMATIKYVNANRFASLPIPFPPLPEQIAIAAYLDQETAKVDALVGKVEAAIERLQEYRTALITAAVTGKIDVRKAAA